MSLLNFCLDLMQQYLVRISCRSSCLKGLQVDVRSSDVYIRLIGMRLAATLMIVVMLSWTASAELCPNPCCEAGFAATQSQQKEIPAPRAKSQGMKKNNHAMGHCASTSSRHSGTEVAGTSTTTRTSQTADCMATSGHCTNAIVAATFANPEARVPIAKYGFGSLAAGPDSGGAAARRHRPEFPNVTPPAEVLPFLSSVRRV